jgi:hypothetical protein
VFDSVVAIDAGVDHLLRHQDVRPESVRDLVYGAMFTRGPSELSATAVFIGGSDVGIGEQILRKVTDCFFSSVRVSVMLDASGANTTAVAAVLAASEHIALADATALVLGATGPVGRRVVRLLARAGAKVGVASRRRARAEQVCRDVTAQVGGAQLRPHESGTPTGLAEALDGTELIIAAGAAGVELLAQRDWQEATAVKVAIDLNAVPPTGIGGIEVADAGIERGGTICYGAIGVGGTKMKIHKAAIRQLFQANDLVLDAEEIYRLGQSLRSR